MKSLEFGQAMLAAQENRINGWVLEFLRASGNNPALADKLEKDGRYFYGPIEYPIKDIIDILGDDNSYKFHEDKATLKAKVDKMVAEIQAGWKAPPLIATNFWEDYFELADGGHRYKAFKKLGIKTYPTIFYFRDESTMNDFKQKIELR
jgi:hypothetical protein